MIRRGRCRHFYFIFHIFRCIFLSFFLFFLHSFIFFNILSNAHLHVCVTYFRKCANFAIQSINLFSSPFCSMACSLLALQQAESSFLIHLYYLWCVCVRFFTDEYLKMTNLKKKKKNVIWRLVSSDSPRHFIIHTY